MMKNYRINFTPMEPYFFGNEKSFKYPGQAQSGKYGSLYYIKSERIPSQSTLLGALRFMFLPNKRTDFNYTDTEIEENSTIVGAESFNITSDRVQNYGAIKRISPVVITQADDILIPTPMDHRVGESEYAPFKEYREFKSPTGKKLYAADYEAKRGITDSYVRLRDGNIVEASELFSSETRLGINTQRRESGLFKKDFIRLAQGYAFSIYAELDEDMLGKKLDGKHEVYLGQNKSVFVVDISESEISLENEVHSFLEKYKAVLPDGYCRIYTLGDAIAGGNIYEEIQFAVTDVKDYRAYMRNFSNRGSVSKGSELYKLIKQGSVFITTDPEKWIDNYVATVKEYKNAEKIGYCIFVK